MIVTRELLADYAETFLSILTIYAEIKSSEDIFKLAGHKFSVERKQRHVVEITKKNEFMGEDAFSMSYIHMYENMPIMPIRVNLIPRFNARQSLVICNNYIKGYSSPIPFKDKFGNITQQKIDKGLDWDLIMGDLRELAIYGK